MEYIIKADDIRRFPELQGFEGEPATPEEMVVMGMTPPAGPTSGGNPIYTEARNNGLDVDEAVMLQNPATRAGADINYDRSVYTQNVSMPSAVSGAGGASSSMLDLLSTPVPQDPMEGLSRNQRMLLGFAAMKDAGMALMGKDSNAVAGVMGDFTERANMERKRRAALSAAQAERARQARIDALLGGISSSVVAGPTGEPAEAGGPADTDAAIKAHDAQMPAFAQLGQMDVWTAKREALVSQRDRQDKLAEEQKVADAEALEKKEKRKASYKDYRQTLVDMEGAIAAATGLSGDELTEALSSGDIKSRKFLFSRMTGFETNDYKTYKSQAAKIAAKLVFENLSEIKSRGETLGTLTDNDMLTLRELSGPLDAETMPLQTAENIYNLYSGIRRTLDAMEREDGLAESGILSDLKKKYPKVGNGG